MHRLAVRTCYPAPWMTLTQPNVHCRCACSPKSGLSRTAEMISSDQWYRVDPLTATDWASHLSVRLTSPSEGSQFLHVIQSCPDLPK